nr:putative inorganic carbon transporter subunit DabA [Vibrio cidicii]
MHEYCSEADPDATLLAQIMTAPMVVTSWINMQYYASTVDPRRYGSGNKTLHNVVGGRLGVFEGNGGDLRIGLSIQSLHDGSRWRHEPLRLTVVIDASEKAIESVIRQHAIVRQLVENQWLYLARFEQEGLAFFEQGRWQRRSLN